MSGPSFTLLQQLGGIGYEATAIRDIVADEMILQEQPLIRLKLGVGEHRFDDVQAFRNLFENLVPGFQAQFQALPASASKAHEFYNRIISRFVMPKGWRDWTHDERRTTANLLAIYDLHALPLGGPGISYYEDSAVFWQVSRFGHACSLENSARIVWEEAKGKAKGTEKGKSAVVGRDRGSMIVKANRNIKKDEVITIDYKPEGDTKKQQREFLMEHYLLDCRCGSCQEHAKRGRQ